MSGGVAAGIFQFEAAKECWICYRGAQLTIFLFSVETSLFLVSKHRRK